MVIYVTNSGCMLVSRFSALVTGIGYLHFVDASVLLHLSEILITSPL